MTQAYLLLVAAGGASQGLRRRRRLAGAHRQRGGSDRHADAPGLAAGAPGQDCTQARELLRGAARAHRRRQDAASCRPKCSCCATPSSTRLPTTCWPAARAKAPDDTDLLYDQAMVAEKLNRLDEMERLLRRLIELKPDNQNAYNALGYSLADRNVRLDEARTLIRKAVQLAPDDPFIADSLGWVEFRLGNTDEALRILEAAYKKRPDPEIGAHLGEVLWASGQRDRAQPDLAGGGAGRRRERDAAGNAQAPARQALAACSPETRSRRPRGPACGPGDAVVSAIGRLACRYAFDSWLRNTGKPWGPNRPRRSARLERAPGAAASTANRRRPLPPCSSCAARPKRRADPHQPARQHPGAPALGAGRGSAAGRQAQTGATTRSMR